MSNILYNYNFWNIQKCQKSFKQCRWQRVQKTITTTTLEAKSQLPAVETTESTEVETTWLVLETCQKEEHDHYS